MLESGEGESSGVAGTESSFIHEEEEGDQLTSLPSLLGSSSGVEAATNDEKLDASREEEEADLPPLSGSFNSEQFNRLDPARRSFSSPSVNVLSSATCSTPVTVASIQQQPNHSQANEFKRPAPAPPLEKLRRRTALGLISFGSAHFRLGGKQNSSSSSSSLDNSNKDKTSSSWRNWFTSASSSHRSSTGGVTSVGEQQTTNDQQQPISNGSKSRASRKFLLRNLRPQSSVSTAEQVIEEAVKQVTTESHKTQVGAQHPKQNNHSNHVQEIRNQVTSEAQELQLQLQQQQLPVPLPVEGTQLANQVIQESEKSRKEASQTGICEKPTRNRTLDPSQSSSDVQELQQATAKSNNLKGTTELSSKSHQNHNKLLHQHQVASSSSTQLKKHRASTSNNKLHNSTSCLDEGANVVAPVCEQASLGSSSCEEKSYLKFEEMTQHKEVQGSSLVDQLIDSQLEWRQIIREANLNSDWSLEDLSEIQIKRQEVIHELVQTERHHCLTLALMRQVYLSGLRKLNESRSGLGCRTTSETSHNSKSLNSSGKSSGALSLPGALQVANGSAIEGSDLIDLERLFPALEDLIAAHELFFAHLRLRLVESCQQKSRKNPVGLVGSLGDLLRDQFRLRASANPESGQQKTTGGSVAKHQQTIQKQQQQQVPANGQKLLQAYAKFCGQHYDSSRYYKHLMQTDKGFKQFIEQCNKQNASCRQRGIPECNLLVTQRLTKYPLLIEQLIKTSKDEPDCEEQKLRDALSECKSLLAELNNQLARKESFERLLDIYAHFCPKSYTIYNKQTRFTKHDLLQHKRLRQLVHSDGQVRVWSATRRKLFQVLCLILNDMVVFLRIESSSSSSSSISPNLPTSDLNKSTQLLDPATLESTQNMEREHQHHQPLLLGSQCALLSAVANALHAHSTASPSHSSNQLVSSVGASVGSSIGLSSSVSSGNSTNSQSLSSHSSGGFSVKYYFANIDNKSSVISLSKLLVREKAAHDGEPRIYLISSSPRQPEMYELAFLSKRHQVGFVDKLKSAIECHTRSLQEALELGAEDDELCDNDNDDQDDDELLELAEFENRTCLCATAEHSMLHLNVPHQALLNNNNSDLDGADEEEDDERFEDEEEDVDDEEFVTPKATYNCLGPRRNDQFQDALNTPVGEQLATEAATATGRSRLEPFELDIEQEVLLAPPNQGLEMANLPSPNDGCEINCQSSDFDEPINLTGEEMSQQPETSTESGLSERAKDSLDEAAPSRQKLRTGRRRRPQRPRNVSNQSSSSSEAAHRQAIELIAAAASSASVVSSTKQQLDQYETEEFDSGRGLDSSSSSSSSEASIASNHASHSATSAVSALATGTSRQDHQFIAPSSCGKSVNHEVPSRGVQSNQPLMQAGENGCQLANAISEASCDSSTVSTGSRSSRSGSCSNQRGTSECKSNLVKCSSILSKSSCSFMKQRKLSTVSTMSSQLKLISKLKSGLLENGQLTRIGRCCPCSCSHLLQQQQQHIISAGCDETKHQGHHHLSIACASQQSTLSKQVRQQLRRSSFVPEQKLEELRDLRIQLDKDKQEWQAKFDRMQEQLLNERRELDLAREKLKQDRQQVANEREQLYRKLDILKEKGILLSPSHKVIITSPELRIYPSTLDHQQYQHHYQANPTYNYTSNNSTRQNLLSNNNLQHSTSSIQIHAQQHRPGNNSALNSTYHKDGRIHENQHHGQRHFMDQTGKVPLHLSESSTNSHRDSHRLSSSINLSKVPLIGSPSSNSLLAERFGVQQSSCLPNSTTGSFKQLESQLI